MKEIRLPFNWYLRDYQEGLWKYLDQGGKRAVIRGHRRSGKDEICLHYTGVAAHKRVGNYWHMLPEYSQARKAIWDAINPMTGVRRIDEVFPPEIRKFTREQEMMIGFQNGSTWQVVGSDNFDSLVGTPPIGLNFSEYALAKPQAWAYLRPILLQNGGWAIFNSTPRGKNHFYKICNFAEKDKDWYYAVWKADKTGVFTEKQLQDELRELQEYHGEDYGKALWLQEYFVSFDAAIPGSIWGDCLDKAKNEGRITRVPYVSGKVFTAWDLGRTDSTAIWFYQITGSEINVLDYHESNFKDIPFYANLLKEKAKENKWEYDTHWFPHDARPRTLASGGKSILQQFMDLDVGRCVIAPKLDKQEQIQAARATFPYCRFDEKNCDLGLTHLQSYHREWDEDLKMFSDRPFHGPESHGADAFSILSLTWKHPKIKKQGAPFIETLIKNSPEKLTFGFYKNLHFKKKREERNNAY